MKKISRAGAIRLMRESEGKIFTVSFIRRNDGSNGEKAGDIRTMNCRTQVKKHKKGGQSPYVFKENNLLSVYDLIKKGYRTINLDDIVSLKIDGQEYSID